MRREFRERFPRHPTSNETAGYRPRYASRHVRNVPAFPAHAKPAIFRIWQEAYRCNGVITAIMNKLNVFVHI